MSYYRFYFKTFSSLQLQLYCVSVCLTHFQKSEKKGVVCDIFSIVCAYLMIFDRDKYSVRGLVVCEGNNARVI